MTRSWNQTKNSSNLRYIATGYLRTYKSRNLNEAIATVRIGRDINIYIHMYIYEHHWNCTRSQFESRLFRAQSWDMGNSSFIKRNEQTDTSRCPKRPSDSFFEVSKHWVSFQNEKALCFASFLPCTPFFFSYALLFLTLQSSEAFWNWRAWAETSHALRKQRKQFFPLSTRRQISSIVRRRYSAVPRQTWIIGIQLFKNYSSAFVVSSLLYPLNKASGHCATAVLPHILHTFPSGRLDVLYQTS